jgi:hypothetical protein
MAKNNKQKVINKWINKAEKDLMAAKINFQQVYTRLLLFFRIKLLKKL